MRGVSGGERGSVRHLREMSWQDVDRCDREGTVVMFACGPVEQHGPQTPLGTDLYIAEHVMYRCAGHLADHGYRVLIGPTVPYVNALFSLPYPGSVSVRRKVVEEYLFDLLSSFATSGFGNLVPTSQHVDPPWGRAAQSACERVNSEHGANALHGFERLVIDLLEDPSQCGLEHVDLRGDSHAGVAETSPMLHIAEHLVGKRLLGELPPQQIEFSRMKEVESFRELGNGLGYTGDLSQSTAAIGERILSYYSERFEDLVLRHLRGEDVRHHLSFSSF